MFWFYRVPNGLRLCASVGVTLFITYLLLSSDPWWLGKLIPTQTGRDLHARLPDWAFHFLAYCGFAFVLVWYGASRPGRIVALLVTFASGHAMLTEFLQRFVPDRTSDSRDLLANFAGIGAGTIAGLILSRLYGPKSDPELEFGLQRSALPQPATGLQETPGFSRERVATAQDVIVPPRIIDYRFLGIASVTGMVVLGSVYALHAWQVQRNAGSLFELGQQARSEGDLEKARDFLGRYVGLAPNDVNALADYGFLIDQTGPNRTARQVFTVFEEVLRNDPTREDIRRRQVEITMQLGRVTDALAHLKVLRQSHPSDGRLDYQAGCCLESLAEIDKAAEAWQTAIKHDPTQVDAYARLARAFYEQLDRPERAHRLLDSMIENNSRSPAAWVSRARFRQDTNQLDDAVADVEEALKLAPESQYVVLAAAELAYTRAADARSHGHTTRVAHILAEIRRLLTDAIQRTPGNLDLRLQAVMLEAHFGDDATALQMIDEILSLSPNDSRARLMIVDVTLQRGDYEHARTAIEQLPRTPGSDALRKYLDGRLLMSQQRWTEAIFVLDQARRLTADAAGMLERTDLALAQCQAQLDDSDAQLTAFRRVLKTNPRSVPARLGLASALLKSGQTAAAIAEYRQLTDLTQVRLLLTRLLIVQNLRLPELARDWAEVERLLSGVNHATDQPAEFALLKAELYAARGQLERARRVIQDARTSQTDRVEFWVALSNLSTRLGDSRHAALLKSQALVAVGNYELAEQQLRLAISIRGSDQVAHLRLIEFLVLQSRQAEAEELYQNTASQMQPHEVAQSFALLGYFDRAKATYERILEVRPHDLNTLQGLAHLYLKQRKMMAVIPLLQRILEPATSAPRSELEWARRQLALAMSRSSDRAKTQQALGVLDRDDEKPDADTLRTRAAILASRPGQREQLQAVGLLEKLSKRNAQLPKDHWLLARLYDGLDRKIQARNEYESLMKIGTTRPEFIRDYILFLIREKELDQAARLCDRLDALQPYGELTVESRVALLVAKGKVEQAGSKLAEFVEAATESDERQVRMLAVAAIAERLSSSTPEDSVANELLSIAEFQYRNLVTEDAAQVSFILRFFARNGRRTDALELLPGLWENLQAEEAAAYSLSVLRPSDVGKSEVDLVEAYLAKAIKLNSSSIVLKICLADLRCLQDRTEEAERIYRIILQVDENHVQAANNLAWLLAMRGRNLNEAMVLVQRAIAYAGPVPQLLDTRGCINLSRGNLQRAIEDFQAATTGSAPASALTHLAIAQQQSGNVDHARKIFAESLAKTFDVSSLVPIEHRRFEKELRQLAVTQ